MVKERSLGLRIYCNDKELLGLTKYPSSYSRVHWDAKKIGSRQFVSIVDKLGIPDSAETFATKTKSVLTILYTFSEFKKMPDLDEYESIEVCSNAGRRGKYWINWGTRYGKGDSSKLIIEFLGKKRNLALLTALFNATSPTKMPAEAKSALEKIL